jgi:hypothetical protein
MAPGTNGERPFPNLALYPTNLLFFRMPGATAKPLDLQWVFYPGYDIRNSAVSTLHWKTNQLIELYRVRVWIWCLAQKSFILTN